MSSTSQPQGMKHLFDRIMGVPGASRGPQQADDEGFFSTQFMERPDAVRATSAWTARALAVGAHAVALEQALPVLDQVWGGDHFYSALSPQDRALLAGYLEFVSVPAGREVILQDERGDYALVVLQGVVAVDRLQPAGGRARLAEARDGDILGEMSLVDAGPRFASCMTLSATMMAVVTSHALDELAIDEPRLGMTVMACMARRLSLRTRQLSARLGALLAGG
jgi:CRP/FNR family transcriptional regulator, cyclic AMP receptor protein